MNRPLSKLHLTVKILTFVLTFFYSSAYGNITWSLPASVSTSLVNASDPNIVIDSNGNATAVWVENGVVLANGHLGVLWGVPVPLSGLLNTSSSPKLGIDSSGNVTTLWVENGVIKSTSLPFGGSWSISASLSGSGASNPSLAVDSLGNAVAVWVRSGNIESATRIGGIWSSVAIISTGTTDNPSVVISSNGLACAVWHSIASGLNTIMSNTLTISGNTWGTAKTVYTGTSLLKQNYPKVAIDGGGNATVVWFQYQLDGISTYYNVQVLASSLIQGSSSWETPVSLSSYGKFNPANLTVKVRMNEEGDTVVVWTNSYDGYIFFIESAQKTAKGFWPLLPDISMPQSPSIYSFGVDLALASSTVLMTNTLWDGTSAITIQSQESDITIPFFQAWTSLNQISTGAQNANPKCALALSGSGNTFLAGTIWIYNNGTNNIVAASLGTGSVIAPPLSLAVSQSSTNFNVYNDYYNTFTWQNSIDPDVIQYDIYRDGLYCASVPANTLQFIDHNQTQGETVTYGVAALTFNYRQSDIVSITLN